MDRSEYLQRFVEGHNLRFRVNPKNVEPFEQCQRKWAEIGDTLELERHEESVMMFCGAKNVGKSSLVRQLLNDYLQAAPQAEDHSRFAYYVDLDPGQPEMTTPGLVSAHLIGCNEKPLTSPTYLNLHHHKPLVRCCVGGLNMSVNPRLYIQNCKLVLEHVRRHQRSQPRRRPVFINTMGFIRGVGLAILVDLIKICHLTHLVVLNIEDNPLRTICTDLSPEVIRATQASFFDVDTSRVNKSLARSCNYQLQVHNLQFVFVESTSVSTKNRVALQLAYFAPAHESLYLPIMQWPRKRLALDRVGLHCTSSFPLTANTMLEIFYLSWVHFVRVHEQVVEISEVRVDRHLVRCRMVEHIDENLFVGCAIVVGYNLETNEVCLVTPLDQDTLNTQVNCIVKPLSIQVPNELNPAP